LAIHGFEAGQLVVCQYRLPHEVQPWIHGVHIGEVVEPGDDPAQWNRHNSERTYCETTDHVPVLYCARFPCSTCRERYPKGFRQHDAADSLIRITAEEAGMPFPRQVLRFVGTKALRNLAQAKYPGAAEVLAELETSHLQPVPAVLPELPASVWNTGYDWIGALRGGWYEVSSWGRDGWDLGSWPLVIIAHYDRPGSFGLAVYVEGDLEVTAYPNREDRDQATDRQAAFHWRQYGHGPRDLPGTDDELGPHHRGPYSRTRAQ
jgi:hypothetical protein